jgi:hypothetical protein
MAPIPSERSTLLELRNRINLLMKTPFIEKGIPLRLLLLLIMLRNNGGFVTVAADIKELAQ